MLWTECRGLLPFHPARPLLGLCQPESSKVDAQGSIHPRIVCGTKGPEKMSLFISRDGVMKCRVSTHCSAVNSALRNDLQRIHCNKTVCAIGFHWVKRRDGYIE